MAHRLTDIRKALVALFINATAAGTNVWDNRARRFHETKLPALHIASLRRTTEVVTDSDILQHRAEFSIAIVVKADDTADDLAEGILDQVEVILMRNPTLNGLTTKPLVPQNLEIGFDGEGERVVAVYVLNISTEYTEEPWLFDDVTEEATRPNFADAMLANMRMDFDVPPFDTAAEHQKWLANNYSTSRPELQGAAPLKGV